MQQTRLYLAAINHFDPLGRERLLHFLAQLLDIEGEPPAFVAPEWNSRAFAEVQRQRPRFFELASTEWPHASASVLTRLAETMGYEADAHTELIPGTEIVWLDDHRIVDWSDLARFSESRIDCYKEVTRNCAVDITDLASLSRALWEISVSGETFRDWARDRTWAGLLLDRIWGSDGNWAISVVGLAHTSDHELSVRRLLEENGVECLVRSLGPPVAR